VGTPLSAPVPVNDSLRLQPGAGGTSLTWQDDPGPYSVYRGAFPTGLSWTGALSCLSGSVTTPSVIDASVPASGALQWYLVTRKGSCGESIAGVRSDGTPIVATPSCP
jgi:hypothetical protein